MFCSVIQALKIKNRIKKFKKGRQKKNKKTFHFVPGLTGLGLFWLSLSVPISLAALGRSLLW